MKRILCALLVFVLAISSVTMQASADTVTKNANETVIYNFLMNELGCNEATALGILANIERESEFNPTLSTKSSSGAIIYGICQWKGKRYEALKSYCDKNGYSYKTVIGQLYFLKHELSTSEAVAWKKMQGIENTAEGAYKAGKNWGQYFERCSSTYYMKSAKRARDVYWPTYCGSVADNNDYDVKRIYGSSRYKTSLGIAEELKAELGIDQFETVIITSGENFPDALAGSYLAAKKEAPILMMNDSETIISLVMEYTDKSLIPGGKVYILGGEAAVPLDVEVCLKENGYDVERLKGKSRYETNLAILKDAGATDDAILVCTGENFADSLSASATGLPILLVDPKAENLSAEQIDFLDDKKRDIYIIGGEAAVNKSYESVLAPYDANASINRIKGKNRYVTSVEVGKTFCSNPTNVALASAQNFPDGLCGGPLAYAMEAPLILTHPIYDANKLTVTKDYVFNNNIVSGKILGGTGALKTDVVKAVFGIKNSDVIIDSKYQQ